MGQRDRLEVAIGCKDDRTRQKDALADGILGA
jgi:hypothetical protein